LIARIHFNERSLFSLVGARGLMDPLPLLCVSSLVMKTLVTHVFLIMEENIWLHSHKYKINQNYYGTQMLKMKHLIHQVIYSIVQLSYKFKRVVSL